MSSSLQIVPAAAEHESGWRQLWSLYCAGELSADISHLTWQRILDPASSIHALIALHDGTVAGFLTFVVHEGTWEAKPICYVEDLYVAKQSRGDRIGIGRGFISALMLRLNAGEWGRIYGITHRDNVIAQRLYDTVAVGEPYLRYEVRSRQ